MNSTYSHFQFSEDVQISRVPRILEMNLRRIRKTMEELNANCDHLMTPPPSSDSLSLSGEPSAPFHDDESMTDVTDNEDLFDARSSISSNDTTYYSPGTSPLLTAFHMEDYDDSMSDTVLTVVPGATEAPPFEFDPFSEDVDDVLAERSRYDGWKQLANQLNLELFRDYFLRYRSGPRRRVVTRHPYYAHWAHAKQAELVSPLTGVVGTTTVGNGLRRFGQSQQGALGDRRVELL
ncbi:uncharacterized protein BT62DRAFT_1002403 [Guyanagaster necrorhizus]|uniref:Uncharacterized protein n=1 Tax=Guyanagaster necrorhizus TaxID=856835 RepID=A0A9P8AWD3_9AGAR|nr:uncharacterized protein BT62DRAFT_1002403 [Guyanagaster necrorhizus MCA 3950]KAG7450066.1 hypothetical protein BT62DRAFT_1002403 [Guyanagaster necrorhizus MCA 3950]